jgi:phage tail protein X
LVDALYPHRGLQERTLSALPALAAYGPELLDDLAAVSVMSGPAVEAVVSADEGASAKAQPCSHQHHILFM